MYAPVKTVAPAALITYAEAKLHLHLDSDEEQTLVEQLISAATEHLDGYTGILGRCLVTQTWRQDFDAFCQVLRLPLVAATITEVRAYAEDDNTGSVVTATNYELLEDALGSYVRFIDDYTFPSSVRETRGVRITFTAGYGIASAVPQNIRAWVIANVAYRFENREAADWVANGLLPVRRVGV